MIDFLKEANISDNTINLIKKENSNNQLYDLYCNQDECLKIINIFQKIGIKNIDQLLINEIQIFYNVSRDVFDKISKYNIEALVRAINVDYRVITQIL